MSVAAITVPAVSHAPSSAEDLSEKISIRDLNFFYGDNRALKDINRTSRRLSRRNQMGNR